MACGSCAGNRKRATDQYRWTSEDGEDVVIYTGKYAEVQASAKTKRKGGSYEPVVTSTQ